MPAPAWVLRRRLRYLYASLFGSTTLSGENMVVSWQRDWDVVRAIKQTAAAPPRKKQVDSELCELWETPLGEFWTPPGVSDHFVTMVVTEALSDSYQFVARKWDGKQPVVLDCGANIGVFTRLALNHNASRVVCFEPSPVTSGCLQKTFAKEISEGRVAILKKGVWNREETLRFMVQNQSNPGSHQIASEEHEGDITIEVTTIDEIVKQFSLPRVDFIKMDIEGAEVNALQGGADTIRRFRPFIGMGTEHTNDIAANNEAVIRTVREIDSTYHVLCTESHLEKSPSRGMILSPYSLFFY